MSDEPRPIAFTTALTPADVLRATTLRVMTHPLGIMAMAIGPIWLAVGLVGSSVYVARIGIQLLPVTIAVAAFALLVGTWAAYRPGVSELFVPVSWTFTPDHVDIEHPGRCARAEWDEFTVWRMAGGCYLLYLAKSRYLIVPRAAVPDADRPAFEALLTERLGNRRR